MNYSPIRAICQRVPQTELVASPPIVLWPNIIVRVSIPGDVEAGLIAPLKE